MNTPFDTVRVGLAVAIGAEEFVDKPVRKALLQALTALAAIEANHAHDLATAAADGFRDGVASVTAGQEPAFGAPTFEQVAPGIEVGYDLFGGVDIRLGGEFVYVHINYDHRYTHNSARAHLADQIVGLLTGKDAAPVAQQPRTALEQYDLDQSPEYRKGWAAGRIKGYEVGYRHATEHAAVKTQQPQAEAVPSDVVRDAARWRHFLTTRPANTHDVINEAMDAAITITKEPRHE